MLNYSNKLYKKYEVSPDFLGTFIDLAIKQGAKIDAVKDQFDLYDVLILADTENIDAIDKILAK